MVIALLSLELHFAGAHSLKEKRMVLRSVKDRLRRFNVSIAEVEYQALWQRAGLAVVTVAASEAAAERELSGVSDEIDRLDPALISRSEIEFIA